MMQGENEMKEKIEIRLFILTVIFLAVFITYFTFHPNKFITNKVIVIVTVIVIIIYMICSCFFEDNK